MNMDYKLDEYRTWLEDNVTLMWNILIKLFI